MMSSNISFRCAEKDHVEIIVRGSGDMASAVAHTLFQAGYKVALHDVTKPATTRRKMAFSDAVFEGHAILENVKSIHVENEDEFISLACLRENIPLITFDFSKLLGLRLFHILVDARMRKRSHPESQIHLAPLTIGLGPNFIAGENVHLAVETSWGESLGDVIKRGPTRQLQGEPKAIAGHARDRYVYSPVTGIFRTNYDIGDVVKEGEVVAQVDDTPLYAPIAGTVRGLVHDGIPIAARTKVIEVDPRLKDPQISGIAERQKKIASGVLRAILSEKGNLCLHNVA